MQRTSHVDPSWRIDREELAWAAGLFDGEGSISAVQAKAAKYPRLSFELGMTAEPAVTRFQRAIGGVGRLFVRRRLPPRQPLHTFAISDFEHVQFAVALLWRWLSPHKRAQASNALKRWHAQPRQRLLDGQWWSKRRREYRDRYNRRPDVKERSHIFSQRPEIKERKRVYMRLRRASQHMGVR